MHPYLDKLRNERAKKNSILCFGMDPVVERMKIDTSKNLADEIVMYFSKILYEIEGMISAVKPNLGYYLQYGNEGIKALLRLVEKANKMGLPVIMDAKVCDIGRTSEAYAKFVFDFLGADSITLNPYMGDDSLEPFFMYKNKGFYLLALTSNRGAKLLQFEQLMSGKLLYEYIIDLICQWNSGNNSVGAVIGATQDVFSSCIEQIWETGSLFPLLIPGVGVQGGSYREVYRVLEKVKYDLGIVRINASSAISYAHERFSSFTVEEASYLALEEILKI